jgi:hypothetical protein
VKLNNESLIRTAKPVWDQVLIQTKISPDSPQVVVRLLKLKLLLSRKLWLEMNLVLVDPNQNQRAYGTKTIVPPRLSSLHLNQSLRGVSQAIVTMIDHQMVLSGLDAQSVPSAPSGMNDLNVLGLTGRTGAIERIVIIGVGGMSRVMIALAVNNIRPVNSHGIDMILSHAINPRREIVMIAVLAMIVVVTMVVALIMVALTGTTISQTAGNQTGNRIAGNQTGKNQIADQITEGVVIDLSGIHAQRRVVGSALMANLEAEVMTAIGESLSPRLNPNLNPGLNPNLIGENRPFETNAQIEIDLGLKDVTATASVRPTTPTRTMRRMLSLVPMTQLNQN